YRLDDCTWLALKELPPPDIAKLLRFIGKKGKRAPPVAQREMRDGSRKQWLNDLLCSHAMSCDSFTELLDVARTANELLDQRGLPILDDAVVVKRAQQVWRDAEAGKLEHWVGREGVARSRGSEIAVLSKLNPKIAPNALMLLIKLRIEHSARCRRA